MHGVVVLCENRVMTLMTHITLVISVVGAMIHLDGFYKIADFFAKLYYMLDQLHVEDWKVVEFYSTTTMDVETSLLSVLWKGNFQIQGLLKKRLGHLPRDENATKCYKWFGVEKYSSYKFISTITPTWNNWTILF